jgi:hypothetical protein
MQHRISDFRRHNWRVCSAAVFGPLALAVARTATAALGADASSIESDQLQMQATRQIAPAAGYTIHEILSPNGTRIREYLSDAGIVFAVSWSGPFKPDLHQLLGSHFETFSAALRAAGSDRNRMSFDTPQLVGQSEGHGRVFYGRVYLPQLVPAGVTVESLR